MFIFTKVVYFNVEKQMIQTIRLRYLAYISVIYCILIADNNKTIQPFKNSSIQRGIPRIELKYGFNYSIFKPSFLRRKSSKILSLYK